MGKYDKYFKKLEKIEKDFYKKIIELNKEMEEETGIKGIEFFWCDGEVVGVGTDDRLMNLVHK